MKKLLTFFVLILTFNLIPQTTSLVQDNVGNNEAVYYFHERNVARTPSGLLMVVWSDSKLAGGQIVYSIYDEAFGIWSPPVALSNAGYRAKQPAIAADELGNIHATWMQNETSSNSEKAQIFYSKFDGLSWGTPVQVSVAASVRGEEATIEVASDGTLWVVYNNDGEGVGKEYLFLVKSTDGGASWSANADTISSIGNFIGSIEMGRASLASGPDGKMVALWDNSIDGVSSRREIFANQYDGNNWGDDVRISDSTTIDRDHNRYCAVAIDNESNIYAFYGVAVVLGEDPRLSYLVMAKKGWNDQWSTDFDVILDSSKANYRSVSAVVDSNDVIHLAYRRDVLEDTTGINEIVYTYSLDKGITWAPRIIVSRQNHDGGYVTVGNRVRTASGIDIAWRESRDEFVNNQDTLAILYANIPYSMIPVGVNDVYLPSTHLILKNYPNPFNPLTNIFYSLPQKDKVKLTIYDALGNEVINLLNEELDAGNHSLVWNGLNNKNSQVTSGIYFAKLTTSNQFKVIKMILLK